MEHSNGSVLAAVLLVVLLVGQIAVTGGLIMSTRTAVTRRVLSVTFVVTMGGAIFQLGHGSEHVAQLGYWFLHPTEPPWMTPWADVIAGGLGRAGGPSSMGTELLHLLGNIIFFVGVVMLAVLVRVCGRAGPAVKTTRITLWLQGFHVLEHVALTLTTATAGQAIGMSTFFGLVGPGPALWTYRIWWHFLANLIVTVLMLRAIQQIRPHYTPARARSLSLAGWARAAQEAL